MEAVFARRSLPGAFGGQVVEVLRTIMIYSLAVFGVLVCLQIVGYRLWSSQEILNTIVPFLPSRSSCDLVSMDTASKLSPPQRQVLDSLLRARYPEVYQSQDDVPDATWRREPIVCEVAWTERASGPFWFRSSYSVERQLLWSGVDETYVWVLFRWVRVHERLDMGRVEVQVQSRLTTG